MAHKGKLKYSAALKTWYVLEKNGNLHELLDSYLIDVDLNLDGHFYPCAINIKREIISFSNIDLRLDRCFDYDILFYIPPRINEDNYFKFDIPF